MRSSIALLGLLLMTACASSVQSTIAPTVFPARTPTPIAFSQADPFLFPTPEPEPTPTVSCERDGAYWSCFDGLLNVEFTVPSRWGAIARTSLGQGGCGGYSYSYSFSGAQRYSSCRGSLISGGGISWDYCHPTEGFPFIGFRERQDIEVKEVDGCTLALFEGASYCETINPNVVMAIFFPEAESMCHPYFGTVYEPTILVAVSLPMERKVQGLSFTTQFLSIQSEDRLFEPLGGVDFNRAMCDDANALEQFDDRAHSIAQTVIDGQIDDETRYHLGLVREFAKSIKVNSR